MTDYITPQERVNPVQRSRVGRFVLALWWRYVWRCHRWEFLKAKHAKAYEIAISWVEDMEACERKLFELGVKPSEVESIQNYFEVWLLALIVIACSLAGWMFTLYRQALLDIIVR